MTKIARSNRALHRYAGQETNFVATIVYENMCVADCLIKMISSTSMKLYVSNIGWLPQYFSVKIDNDNYLNVKRVAEENDHITVDFQYA